MESWITSIALLIIIGGGVWFAIWAIKRTLKDNSEGSRKLRRKRRKR